MRNPGHSGTATTGGPAPHTGGSGADIAARNRVRQAELYGEPLGELLARATDQLGITRARLAGVLGLSAPMLSQLMSGQRTKIGNPAAVRRMQELVELGREAAGGRVHPDTVEGRLAEVSLHTGAMTATTQHRPTAAATAHAIQALLRQLSSAGDLLAAAELLEPDHPELADFLRVYGAGRTDDAVAHLEAHADQ